MKEKLADFAAGVFYRRADSRKHSQDIRKTGYVMDTHTAVASHVSDQYREQSKDTTKCVIDIYSKSIQVRKECNERYRCRECKCR